MVNKTFLIAYYTFIEATRNRMFRLTLTGLVILFGLAEFIGELAITETSAIQSLLVASVARWFIVTATALFVITSMVRELNDKGTDMLLSLPVSRTGYYFGKYTGFLALAWIITVLSGVMLLLYAVPSALPGWLLSMACEVAIVVALSMLCLFTFSNITVAFIVVMAFYILARSISAIVLLSTSPVLETKTWSQEFMNWLVSALAWVMPDLDRFSDSAWLVYGIESGTLTLVLIQTFVYLALLISAGLFDLHRREF